MTVEKLLTVPDFSQSMNITQACTRRWILERKVATVKLGRLVRIPESEVERLIQAGLRPVAGKHVSASRSSESRRGQ